MFQTAKNDCDHITKQQQFPCCRIHAYLKRGVLHYQGREKALAPFIADAILRNDRIRRIEAFAPATEAERDKLCRIYKVNRPDLVSLSSEHKDGYAKSCSTLRDIFDEKIWTSGKQLRAALKGAGYNVMQEDDNFFAVDFSTHTIIDLGAEGFDLSKLTKKPAKPLKQRPQVKKHKPTRGYSVKKLPARPTMPAAATAPTAKTKSAPMAATTISTMPAPTPSSGRGYRV